MGIQISQLEDINKLIEVAKDVGYIMRNSNMSVDPKFLCFAERKIKQNEAIMAYNDIDKQCVGIIGFSRHNNSITWLGVKEKYRYKGMASSLLKLALENLDCSKCITVNTYPKDYLLESLCKKSIYKIWIC